MNSQLPTRNRQNSFEYLLIDISNSFTKYAFAGREKTGRANRIPTRELSLKTLGKIISGKKFGTVVLSSVVPEKEKLLVRMFRSQRLLRVSPRLDLGVGIDYPKPSSIGSSAPVPAVAAPEAAPAGSDAVEPPPPHAATMTNSASAPHALHAFNQIVKTKALNECTASRPTAWPGH